MHNSPSNPFHPGSILGPMRASYLLHTLAPGNKKEKLEDWAFQLLLLGESSRGWTRGVVALAAPEPCNLSSEDLPLPRKLGSGHPEDHLQRSRSLKAGSVLPLGVRTSWRPSSDIQIPKDGAQNFWRPIFSGPSMCLGWPESSEDFGVFEQGSGGLLSPWMRFTVNLTIP